MDEDQMSTFNIIYDFLNVRRQTEIVSAARLDVENLFGKEQSRRVLIM